MPNSKYLIIAASGVIAIALVITSGMANTCTVRQASLIDDLKRYDQSKSPEFCATLNDRIAEFDSKCTPSLDVLDCG